MFSYSSYNKQEVPGECTEEALNARDVRWAKQRPLREPKERAPVKETGIPAEDGEDLGIEYRSVQVDQLNVAAQLSSTCRIPVLLLSRFCFSSR